MLRLKRKPKASPVTITHKLQGREITLMINPWDDDAIDRIREKHTAYKFAKDPDTGQMKQVKVRDVEAVGKDSLDFLLLGFSGVMLDGEELPITRENKFLLDAIKLADGEVHLQEVVMETALALRAAIEVEKEQEIKNSPTSPGSTAAREMK